MVLLLCTVGQPIVSVVIFAIERYESYLLMVLLVLLVTTRNVAQP